MITPQAGHACFVLDSSRQTRSSPEVVSTFVTITSSKSSSFAIIFVEHSVLSCYCYPKPAPFLHAIWGGTLRGKPVFLAGCRAGDKDFFLVEHTSSGLRAQLIETGAGPSNVTVLPAPDHDTILIANRESHEAAVFTVTD